MNTHQSVLSSSEECDRIIPAHDTIENVGSAAGSCPPVYPASSAVVNFLHCNGAFRNWRSASGSTWQPSSCFPAWQRGSHSRRDAAFVGSRSGRRGNARGHGRRRSRRNQTCPPEFLRSVSVQVSVEFLGLQAIRAAHLLSGRGEVQLVFNPWAILVGDASTHCTPRPASPMSPWAS